MKHWLDPFRALGLELYLWAQRHSQAVPDFLRPAMRRWLAGVAPTNVGGFGRAEEWPGFGDQHRGGHDHSPEAKSDTVEACLDDDDRSQSTPPAAAGRKLRCVVATNVLGFGGLDKVAALLGRRLPLHGFDTAIAYFDDVPPGHHGSGERLTDTLRHEGVRVAKLSPRHGPQWLRICNPDVISVHGAPDWFLEAAAEAGIPIIETLHGAHTFFEKETWPKERLRSRQIDGLVAVSDLVRSHYLRINPTYSPRRIVTIPNGVDDRIIARRDRNQARAGLGLSSEFLFISLGRYHLQKNTYGLVAAFSDVARTCPHAHLLIAGHIHDATYFEQVRRLRDSLPCADQIHLHEHCPDVAAVLAAADAFVLNSFFEGWSLASMEALFAGLPVVMSDVGGAREQIGQDKRRGFIVGNPLGDPEAIDWRRMSRARFQPQVNRENLVKAMCAVIADRNYWNAIRRDLQEESTERFSADRCVRRHAEVLERAAARHAIDSSCELSVRASVSRSARLR
jgi:glycosyltransferase involved in cell wall biosynthesis